jgi:hypothetical protein
MLSGAATLHDVLELRERKCRNSVSGQEHPLGSERGRTDHVMIKFAFTQFQYLHFHYTKIFSRISWIASICLLSYE